MTDLREWLSEANGLGQLQEIVGVHWDLELATLIELLNERKKPRPAVLFDSIVGYPQGYRVAANLLSSVNRLSLTVGMSPKLTEFEFIQKWRRRVKKIEAIEPEMASDGPLFENVMRGSDIDLFHFPVPRWHELDGGRYIGTDDLVVTKDPDEGWTNVGTYRVMVHHRDRLGLYISPGKHGRVHRDKYLQAGRPLPVAVYFRHNPILCGFPLLKPSSGDTLHFSLMRSALIWNALDEAGVPDVRAVWVHPAAGRFLTVVAINQRYPGHAKQAATIASQCRSGAYLGRYVVVVDEDIDITNSDEVLWALCTRSDPIRSIDILRRCWSGPLDPAIPPEEKGFSSRALIDATRPYEWREKFPPATGASRELKEKVEKKWAGILQQATRTEAKA